jgi:hypothetical protein
VSLPVTSGDVISGNTTSHHLKCDFGCADILLAYLIKVILERMGCIKLDIYDSP